MRERRADGSWLPAFDHDEARRLRLEEGLTYKQIAERFGVTYQAVFQVCPRERERVPAGTASERSYPELRSEDLNERDAEIRRLWPGLTQEQLAERFGVSPTQVWNILHGKRTRSSPAPAPASAASPPGAAPPGSG